MVDSEYGNGKKKKTSSRRNEFISSGGKRDKDVKIEIRLMCEKPFEEWREAAKRLIAEMCGNLILFLFLLGRGSCRNDFFMEMKSTVKTSEPKARNSRLLCLVRMIN